MSQEIRLGASQLQLGLMREQGAPDCPHAQLGRLPKPRPRVISASKRTDIPAFKLPWMIERCEAGWVDVPNPMFRHASDPLKRLTHVSLLPEHVVAIVWWSKNYRVYQKNYNAFENYRRQYFQFTINPRRPDLQWLEPDVPPVEEALSQVEFLSKLPGGPEMVAWRYDPICFWTDHGAHRSSWDPAFFERLCRDLTSLGVRTCFTSIADLYGKAVKRVERLYPGRTLRDPTDEELALMAGEMARIASRYGMRLFTCTEARLRKYQGFSKGACIDGALLRASVAGATDRKMRGREECGCTLHTDIGDYESQECGYSCIYCYANPSRRAAISKETGPEGAM